MTRKCWHTFCQNGLTFREFQQFNNGDGETLNQVENNEIASLSCCVDLIKFYFISFLYL